MTSDSATVGCAVGIPSGVILVALVLLYWRSRRKISKHEEKTDPLHNVDLEADLTFDNFQELAGPQSPMMEKPAEFQNIETAPDQNTKRTKSKRYRTYSYHPSMKAQNQQLNIRPPLQTDATKTPETSYSSSTNVTKSSDGNSTPNGTESSRNTANHPIPHSESISSHRAAHPNVGNLSQVPKRNSEHLLQNYFEGVIPVVPPTKTSETANSSSRNSSSTNLAPPAVQQDNTSNHSRSSSNTNIKPPKSSRTKSLFKRSKSISNNNVNVVPSAEELEVPPNVNNYAITGSDSSDSLSQQYFIKSLNKTALESNDFTMPIPGNNRTSVIFEKRNSVSDLGSRGNSNSKLSNLVETNPPHQAQTLTLKPSSKATTSVTTGSEFAPPSSSFSHKNGTPGKNFYIESETNSDLDAVSASELANETTTIELDNESMKLSHANNNKKTERSDSTASNPFENPSNVVNGSLY